MILTKPDMEPEHFKFEVCLTHSNNESLDLELKQNKTVNTLFESDVWGYPR